MVKKGDLEVDFTKWFAAERERLRADGVRTAGDQAEGVLADDFTTFLSLLIDGDLIGAMDLEIGENTILKEEPSGSPPLAVVDPLVQNPRYSIPNYAVDPNRRQPR